MKITGRPTKTSKEFVRSWLHASLCVLAYHNYPVNSAALTVKILDLTRTVNGLAGGPNGGTARRRVDGGQRWDDDGNEIEATDRCHYCLAPPGLVGGTIKLERTLSKDGMATVILHEAIHIACGGLHEPDKEHVCSTLTAKLKPEVAPLAQALLDGTYRRAAYLAHTKLSYRLPEGDGDRYNRAQWVRVDPTDPYQTPETP